MKFIEQVAKKSGKIIIFHDLFISLAQGWFSKLKKTVSSVSTVSNDFSWIGYTDERCCLVDCYTLEAMSPEAVEGL